MVTIPEKIKNLNPYVPGISLDEMINDYGLEREDIVKLASNENPLIPPERVFQAMRDVMTDVNLYPDGESRLLKKRLSETFGMPDQSIIVGNGSAEIIENTALAFMDTHSCAIGSQYGFALYKKAVAASNHVYVEIPVLENYQYDLKGILKAINNRTSVIYIANPNNPTGASIMVDDLMNFLFQVDEDILVVLDEAYIDFSDVQDFPNGVEILKKTEMKNLLVVRTFSKVFALAGLRVGYAFGDPSLISWLNRVRTPVNLNMFAQAACREALSCSDFISETVSLIRQGKEFLQNELASLGLTVFPSQGNFLMVEMEEDCTILIRRMLESGIVLRHLKSFGLDCCFRVTIGTMEQNRKCIEGLSQFL